MWQSIRETFSAVDWAALFENFSNDRVVKIFTHPYGLAGLGVLLLLSVLLKWRLLFVGISTALLISVLMRYTLADNIDGPDKTVLMFAGGAVAVGAFVIYYLFIRED